MKVTYDETIPPPILPIIKERFARILKYFPTWCHEVIIEYSNDSGQEAALSLKADFPYRYIRVYVYDYWLQEEDWELVLFHELMHAVMTPITLKVERVLDAYLADNETRKYLNQELIDAEEGVCQDLAKLARDLTNYRK